MWVRSAPCSAIIKEYNTEENIHKYMYKKWNKKVNNKNIIIKYNKKVHCWIKYGIENKMCMKVYCSLKYLDAQECTRGECANRLWHCKYGNMR